MSIRVHSWFKMFFVFFVCFVVPFLPPQGTRGGIAVRARPSAPTTHYFLLPPPYSLLAPFVCICGSKLFFVCFVLFVVPFLSPRATRGGITVRALNGSPLQSDHALLSSPFSLLSTCPINDVCHCVHDCLVLCGILEQLRVSFRAFSVCPLRSLIENLRELAFLENLRIRGPCELPQP